PPTAAASDLAGTRQTGAKRPARPAAANAPRMIPKSMTEVTSVRTLACSSAARGSDDQYGHAETSTPANASGFDPDSANADVTPHGRPASASVATFTSARPIAPAASGHGPRRYASRGTSVPRR